MRHALHQEKWQNLLPNVYRWLQTAKFSTGKELAGHILLTAKADEATKAVTVDAPGLDKGLAQSVNDAIKRLGWSGKSGPFLCDVGGKPCTVVINDGQDVEAIRIARKVGLDAGKALRDLSADSLTIVPGEQTPAVGIFEGLVQGLYNCDAFKGKRKKDLENFPAQVFALGENVSADDSNKVRTLAQAGIFVRFLQDAPANYLDPVKFAEIAADVAKEVGAKCTILDKEAMTKRGMGSLLSVADGSSTEARLITLEIDGQNNSKCVGLVGKGLTFDSGGISIKPSQGMEEMKFDMSGGAAVLGAAMTLAKLRPPTKVVCVIAASENMPSGSATKPGDVVRAMNGKTIEVLNTDAEGRLVLADALAYVVADYKPNLVLDIATLTGAVLQGLGTVGAAVVSNDQATADYVIRTAQAWGEPLWQLPLWPELKKEVKGDIADLRNIAKGNVKAGTIIGAAFLREFVGDTKWAHLDIAGTAWNTLAIGYPQSQGSAFGLRSLVAACLSYDR